MGTFRLDMGLLFELTWKTKALKHSIKKKSKKPKKLEALTIPSFHLDSTAVYQEIKR